MEVETEATLTGPEGTGSVPPGKQPPGNQPLTPADLDKMRQVYHHAQVAPLQQFTTLSQPQFCGNYGDQPSPWRIGPFAIDPSMTFRKEKPCDDPTGIGWQSGVLANPTLIEHDGALHLFYRANPRKESQAGRVGHATYHEATGWTDLSGPPVLFPETIDEVNSLEDPKLYRVGDTFYMFYNTVWEPDPAFSARVRRGYRDWGIFVVTKLAVSNDLVHFERLGQVVPYEVSQGWSKGAVIPRSPSGEAVRIGGEYLMFLSEGCGDRQFIGRSPDMVQWKFETQTYLDLPESTGSLAEVACCAAEFEPTGQFFVLDFFYRDNDGAWQAGQALYHVEDPTQPIAIEHGGTLAWGGLLQYQGDWVVMQGWDSPQGEQELFLYRSTRAAQTPDIG